MEDNLREEITGLVERSKIAIVGSVNGDGFPNAKAMLNVRREGLRTHWFITNLSARRTAQFRANPKACVYFVDGDAFQGLMLVGEMEVLTDRHSRSAMWREEYTMYYPDGVDDPDYCVLRFAARTGNYYHGLKNCSFEV